MKLNPNRFFKITILALALSSCKTLKPLAPAATEVDIPKLIQPVSNVEVPVTVDLKSYFVQAENSVPNKFSGNKQACEGLSYAYTFTRTPFIITSSNSNVVDLNFVGSYGFTASYCAKCADLLGNGPQCIVPTVSAQCGMGDEPPRRMEISYRSTINI